jgi:hypothetical protein
MLSNPRAPLPIRFASQMVQGASRPVGGDAEASIRAKSTRGSGGGLFAGIGRDAANIWGEAKGIARGEAA